jgi:internalin A
VVQVELKLCLLAAQQKIMTQPLVKNQVFASYSHKDRKFLEELRAHLKPLERAARMTTWSDQQIQPGDKWFSEIQAALASSKVVVMLLTSNFLASEFIHEHELGPILKEAEAGGVRILWIMVRACSYQETALRDYQAVLPLNKPLAEMKAERDSAWVEICKVIKKAVE